MSEPHPAPRPAPAALPSALNRALLQRLLWREWQHHPWRHLVALFAVALGVALAWSVHLINTSALAEFSTAVRSANGEPDLTLRSDQGRFDDALLDRVVNDPAVLAASPVLELDTYARRPPAAAQASTEAAPAASAPSSPSTSAPTRQPVRLLGVDALQVAPLALNLLPRAAEDQDRLAFLAPDKVFLNPAARQQLDLQPGQAGQRLQLLQGSRWLDFTVAGDVAVGGAPLLVLDIAAAQARFGAAGQISRLDLRLTPGADPTALAARWALPPGVRVVPPDEAAQKLSTLSRAYRVNLTVLAGVALFVGAFLVFSVVALSVAQRTPALALLGVLGLTAQERRGLVLWECGLLGAAGSVLGLLGGWGLAVAALRLLSGDLGGGYFPGITPTVQWSGGGALLFGALGLLSALVGGWWPALAAQRLAPAQALKGLGLVDHRAPPAWPGLALLAAGAALAFVPPLWGLPLAAYAAVALLLFGGVALVPAAVAALLSGRRKPRGALALLAVQRARFQRRTATAAVAGVVASLALSVALTVMVGSFRQGVASWLDSILPADLYARTATSGGSGDVVFLPEGFVAAAAQVPGVLKLQGSRTRPLSLAPGQPSVALVTRELSAPAEALPLLASPLPARPGEVGVFVSEAVVALYGVQTGALLNLPAGALRAQAVPVRVRGVWRDYARQFGAIAMDQADYQRLSGDTRLNDLALWLQPGADIHAVQAGLRALLPSPELLEFAATQELRVFSLRIFDRSFAVTYYLQAVAIAIGLVGIAASLSAQVLARRKEFGLLAHLGLTRRQVVAVVAGEGAAWMAAGTLVGLALGIAVSLVLVFVVNPQSFHWTMDLVLPWGRLAALCVAVMVAGTLTAAVTARSAAVRQAVLSVKEDW